jgi:hypothetical protein
MLTGARGIIIGIILVVIPITIWLLKKPSLTGSTRRYIVAPAVCSYLYFLLSGFANLHLQQVRVSHALLCGISTTKYRKRSLLPESVYFAVPLIAHIFLIK